VGVRTNPAREVDEKMADDIKKITRDLPRDVAVAWILVALATINYWISTILFSFPLF